MRSSDYLLHRNPIEEALHLLQYAQQKKWLLSQYIDRHVAPGTSTV